MSSSVNASPPSRRGAQHQALESLPVRPSRLVVTHPHVQVVPVLGQIVGMRRALEVPDVDRIVRRVDHLSRQLIFQSILGRQDGVLTGGEPRLLQRRDHARSARGAAQFRGSGGGAPLRLYREGPLPTGRQARRGQAQKRAARQQLEELPPTRSAVGDARI